MLVREDELNRIQASEIAGPSLQPITENTISVFCVFYSFTIIPIY